MDPVLLFLKREKARVPGTADRGPREPINDAFEICLFLSIWEGVLSGVPRTPSKGGGFPI